LFIRNFGKYTRSVDKIGTLQQLIIFTMKKIILLIAMLLISGSVMFAQVAINEDGSAPDASALLDLYSTNKGVLIPRITSEQIAAINSPADGLMVYNSSDKHFYYYTTPANTWVRMARENEGAWSCGSSFTVLHNAGNIAPVSKLITYGTVTNIPGETSKCWITSNLGAAHQATAVNDATEASAGWYWQFNRMQGYKHDGTTRTPNTTWISSISENSNWTTANDPCALLLGSGWRLPTSTEWTNVDASGGWTNWNGPWNSALIMHAAGALFFINGSLLARGGSAGAYWNSSQYDGSYGWDLYFDSGYCDMNIYNKAGGFSSRCLRD
jgi:hypothetical protein